jgi:hypothetical protein
VNEQQDWEWKRYAVAFPANDALGYLGVFSAKQMVVAFRPVADILVGGSICGAAWHGGRVEWGQQQKPTGEKRHDENLSV